MEKCFITKLPSSVDNDGIARLGEIPLYFDVDESPNYKNRAFIINMYSQPERTLRIYNGYFTDKTLTQNLGTTLTLPATGGSDFSQTFYVSNTKCTVFIPIRYTSYFNVMGQTTAEGNFVENTKYIDLEDIKYTKANGIRLNNSNRLDWDIAKVAKYFPNIIEIEVEASKCFGDISALSNLTNLNSLDLGATKVVGNISSFSNLINLTSLILNNTNIVGDISTLSNLTKLTVLNLRTIQVAGDISSFSRLVNLQSLLITGTNIIGDISVIIDNMPRLKTLYISTKVTATDAQIKILQDRGVTVLRW